MRASNIKSVGTSLVGLLVICAGLVSYRDKDRPGAAIVTSAKQALHTAQAGLAEANSRPDLPPLFATWDAVRDVAQSMTVDVDPKGSLMDAGGKKIEYAGLSNNWSMTVKGPLVTVMPFLWTVTEFAPVVVNGIEIVTEADSATPTVTAAISVLGATTP